MTYTTEFQGNANINFKRSMRLLLKDMAGLKGTLGPKRGLTAWVLNANKVLTRVPMEGKALPLISYHF